MLTLKKWLPTLLIIIGIAAIIIGLGADLFPFGNKTGIGSQQMTLAILGLVFAILGFVLRSIWGKK